MRELRNCHIKGNFVTETALLIGAVETSTRLAVGVSAGFSFPHEISFRQFEKKSVNPSQYIFQHQPVEGDALHKVGGTERDVVELCVIEDMRL